MAQLVETNYSAFINDHSDSLTRRALPDLDGPAGGNVVAITRKP